MEGFFVSVIVFFILLLTYVLCKASRMREDAEFVTEHPSCDTCGYVDCICYGKGDN